MQRGASSGERAAGHFRYFDFVMAAFVVDPAAVERDRRGEARGDRPAADRTVAVRRGHPVLSRSSYVIGDVLTEVYGYARARRVHLGGVRRVAVHGVHGWVVVALPPAPAGPGRRRTSRCSAQVRGSSLASIARSGSASSPTLRARADEDLDRRAGICGRGRSARRSSGQGLDSLIFYPLAFSGAPGWTTEQM